jgi:hypothetical protein
LQELAPPLRGDPSGATPRADSDFYELLDEGAWLESKVSDGGTAMSRVRDQLAQARQVLREARG